MPSFFNGVCVTVVRLNSNPGMEYYSIKSTAKVGHSRETTKYFWKKSTIFLHLGNFKKQDYDND
jgi:hypothetical protein